MWFWLDVLCGAHVFFKDNFDLVILEFAGDDLVVAKGGREFLLISHQGMKVHAMSWRFMNQRTLRGETLRLKRFYIVGESFHHFFFHLEFLWLDWGGGNSP